MTFLNVLDSFFLPEDGDAFARSMGWQDREQMAYYEDQTQEVPPMTDNEVEQLVEREEGGETVTGTVEYLAPPPSEILVLARQDSREIYTDSEDCPRDGDFEMIDWQDLSGVY